MEVTLDIAPFCKKKPDINKSRNVDVIFLFSTDHHNSKQKHIIGFYGFPEFGGWYERKADHPLFRKYDGGNFKAHTDDIIHFDNSIMIDNDNVKDLNLLPIGKQISQQGFNYLNSDNVKNIISLALKLNPQNKKLKDFVQRFPLLIEIRKEAIDLDDFYQTVFDTNADSLAGISELEKRMGKQTPEVKERISTYIERGAIANKVKQLTGYKCLLCEALGLEPFSFKKPNGNPYVETHHVEPVSTLKKGVLSINNLITVCANHHRQLHYGNSEVVENTSTNFKFKIDGKIIEVKAIRLM